MRIATLVLCLLIACCGSGSVSKGPAATVSLDSMEGRAADSDLQDIFRKLGFVLNVSRDVTLSWTSHSGPCGVGELSGDYVFGVTKFDGQPERDAFLAYGEAQGCGGYFALFEPLGLVPVTTFGDLFEFPQLMTALETEIKKLVDAVGTCHPEKKPVYWDELPGSLRGELSRRLPSFVDATPPRAAITFALLQQRLGLVVEGPWEWSEARQFLFSQTDPGLDGKFVIRGTARDLGASVVLDSEGRVEQLVLWQGCKREPSLFP